jgi:diguanylate cyclase (GGDEF)-like protein
VLSTLAVFALFGLLLGRQADRLYELSSEDPLTGLGNRRRFQARLEEEFARAQRYGAPLSVLVADLDGLKELNDRCGHRIGDEALTRVASAIRTGSRAADFAARWGGDEFALLAPSTGSEDAVRLAERVRSLASEHDSGRERISVSIGVATFDPKSGTDSAEGLMRQADAALYAAKAAGRDRVVVG